MEMIPALPWKSRGPSVSTPIKQSTKQGDARGASEVRHGTSSNHLHCPAPRSSSYIGHRFFALLVIVSVRMVSFSDKLQGERGHYEICLLSSKLLRSFFEFASRFGIEKWWVFLVNFLWYPFPRKQNTKKFRKFRGKFGASFGANFGSNIRKFWRLFVLHPFLTYGDSPPNVGGEVSETPSSTVLWEGHPQIQGWIFAPYM